MKFLLSVLLAVAVFFQAAGQTDPGINLQRYEYPYRVHYMHTVVEREPVRIAYMDVRPSSPNGKVVLLLHGKNFPSAYWRGTIEALSDAGYRVIAPDALGFGKSSKPVVQYSFSLLAQLDKQLLDSLGIGEIAVVGHSMGGMLATRFVLSYPEMVSGLVLEDALGLEDWRSKGVPFRKVDAWYKDERNATYESILKYHRTSYYPQWKKKYQKWVDIQYGMKLGKNRHRLDWVNALTYDMIFNQPVVHEFRNIKVPALVVVGLEDKTKLARGASGEVSSRLGNYKRLGKKAASAIPDAALIEYPGVGHIPHLEIPGRFNKDLISFLDSL
jgi:pimeloyl-ACP methyl ester carboxylesterase